MRLLTWNVGYQTRVRAMPTEAARALVGLSPDLVVLNEYVYSAEHEDFFRLLAEQGLTHLLVSDHVVGQNQVAIVSRHKLDATGAIACDAGLSEATRPNWLHVKTNGFDVIGLRRPMFNRIPRAVSRYWDWFGSATSSLLDGRTVALGDFNAPGNAAVLKRLATLGWRLVTPDEGWSYRTRSGRGESAIDHALVSPLVRVDRAAYVANTRDFSFAGAAGSYSDHAVLVVDLHK